MERIDSIILVTHLLATGFMTGLVWFVQIVHYPLFAGVGGDCFIRYQRAHVDRTGPVVGPTMLIEAACAAWLAASMRPLALAGAALLALVWVSTWEVQVPLHHRLARGFEAVAAARLVRTNWIRTVAWTGRSAIAAAMVVGELPP